MMKQRRVTLDQFIGELNRLATRHFPVCETHELLKSVILAPEQLQPYLFVAPDQYTRNLIYKSPEFELLLIAWPAGQAAPIHGHEGEKCWARVEKGELCFTNYCEIPEGDSFRLKTVSTRVGDLGYLDGPADIHKVENTSNRLAVTLHLYSRPFDACYIYDLANGRKMRLGHPNLQHVCVPQQQLPQFAASIEFVDKVMRFVLFSLLPPASAR
jgi:predicted metal-dependent enzyme (double-stranded beta helix superfamily)